MRKNLMSTKKRSKRSIACEFDEETRKSIIRRDKKCIMSDCKSNFGISIAHIFLNRSQGGLGNKFNGLLLCQTHHHMLDNGNNNEQRKIIREYCENYLIDLYGKIDKKMIKYSKYN